MKTAISLPDDLFRKGEHLAKRLGIARSQLYARAISEFVDRHDSADITARLNVVYGGIESDIDPIISELQAAALEDEAT